MRNFHSTPPRDPRPPAAPARSPRSSVPPLSVERQLTSAATPRGVCGRDFYGVCGDSGDCRAYSCCSAHHSPAATFACGRRAGCGPPAAPHPPAPRRRWGTNRRDVRLLRGDPRISARGARRYAGEARVVEVEGSAPGQPANVHTRTNRGTRTSDSRTCDAGLAAL